MYIKIYPYTYVRSDDAPGVAESVRSGHRMSGRNARGKNIYIYIYIYIYILISIYKIDDRFILWRPENLGFLGYDQGLN